MASTEREVKLPGHTYDALQRLRREKETDDHVLQRALDCLHAMSVLKAASADTGTLWNVEDLQKTITAVRKMSEAGYTEERITSLCRALFCDQSNASLEDAFKQFDKNGSGCIDKAEMRQALPLMGEDVSEERMDELFSKLDVDGSEKIELHEFSRLVKKMNLRGNEQLDEAFESFRSAGGTVGSVLSAWTTDITAGAAKYSAAWNAHIRNPMDMRKAGQVVLRMKEAGYEEHKANSICKALFDQTDEDMQEAFQFFDVNANENIDKEEFKRAMKLMGEDMTPERIDELMVDVDADKNGTLSLSEFCTLVKRINPREDPTEGAPSTSGKAIDAATSAAGDATASAGALVSGFGTWLSASWSQTTSDAAKANPDEGDGALSSESPAKASDA